MKDILISRREVKKGQAADLRRLYGMLDPLAREYFLVLVYMAESGRAVGQSGKAEISEGIERCTKVIEPIHTFMREKELEFPGAIRALLGQLTDAWQLKEPDFLPSASAVLRKTDEVNSVVKRLKAEIRKELQIPDDDIASLM